MLKARNILIIFILNYLLILLFCVFMELYYIGNEAQEIQIMMRTAADMALDQMQASDDFFTNTGYLGGDSSVYDELEKSQYKMLVMEDNNVVKKNFFSMYSGKDNIHEINEVIYPNSDMMDFINDVPGVKKITFLAGELRADATTTSGSVDNLNVRYSFQWFTVPKIAQLSTISDIENSIIPISTNDSIARQLKAKVIQDYELGYSNREYDDGTPYSLTPLSLGITYLNPEVLQAYYMNNLQLLMRAKYIDKSSYNPLYGSYSISDGYEGGIGLFKGNSYADLVNENALSEYNPINNGKFTLLLGNRVIKSGSSEGDIEIYLGIDADRLPTIEYKVIDMYNNTEQNNAFMKQLFGAKTSNGMSVTGAYFKELDKESIDYYKEVLGYSSTDNNTMFDHKYAVVAKVTFYADFIVPYNSVGLREMRARAGNYVDRNGDSRYNISGRKLFDAFFETGYEDVSSSNNFVDLILDMGQSETGMSYFNQYGIERHGLNSDPMVYTTLFAVTP